MKILVACEESQAVTIELRKLGNEAYSCDIEPCSGGHPEWHVMHDVTELINGHTHFFTCDKAPHYISGEWDMIIAFPPCTYLSNAGACRLYPKKGVLNQERYEKGLEAKKFFMIFYNADCPRIAVENPVSSKIYDMPTHSQEIQPWQFGHPYTKKQDCGYVDYNRLYQRRLCKIQHLSYQLELEEKIKASTEHRGVRMNPSQEARPSPELQKPWQNNGLGK